MSSEKAEAEARVKAHELLYEGNDLDRCGDDDEPGHLDTCESLTDHILEASRELAALRSELVVAREALERFAADHSPGTPSVPLADPNVGAARGEGPLHARPEEEKQDLRPRLEALADKLCQTQPFIIGALEDVGLTVVRLTSPGATGGGEKP